MKERLTEDIIAMRAARELQPGEYCNLGVGMPGLCAAFVREGIYFQTENGGLNYGPLVTADNWQQVVPYYTDAGGRPFSAAPGMSFFDMLTSFAMIRSGRIISILGGLEVSEKGDLANHSTGEGDEHPMIGGAMDLTWGAKRVIVTMTHTTKEGRPKVVKELSLPPTGKSTVDLIVTDLAVIQVTRDGLVLKEVVPGWTAEEVQGLTEPRLIIASDLRDMEL